jgi:hypothetical protein
MTMRTEEDLRIAYDALAAEAPDADAVRTAVQAAVADPDAGLVARRSQRGRRRLVVPVAAAAAVVAVAVIATTLAITSGTRTPASAARQLLARLPRYYVALVGPASGPYEAVAVNSLTGATVATVRPPAPDKTFIAVSGAADDRTFVLAAVTRDYGWAASEMAWTPRRRASF